MAGFNDRLNLGMQPMNIQDPELEEQMRMAQASVEGEVPVQPQAAPRPKTPFDDPRYQEAIDHQKKQQRYADILRSFQSMVSTGTGADVNTTVADAMEKRAGQPLEEYNFRMQQEDKARKEGIEDERFGMDKEKHQQSKETHNLDTQTKQLALDKLIAQSQDDKLTDDATSEISQHTQDKFIEISKKLGRPYNEASVRAMSAKQLHNIEPGIQDYLKNLWDEKKAIDAERRLDKRDDKNHTQAKELKEMDFENTRKKEKASLEKQEKKVINDDLKNIWKENRKIYNGLDAAKSTAETSLAEVKALKKAWNEHKAGTLIGSNPYTTLWGWTGNFLPGDQLIRDKFSQLSFKTLVSMFSGMSKAIDSDAERRAFEATQPRLGSFEGPNDDKLNVLIESLENLVKKTTEAKSKYSVDGRWTDKDPADPKYNKEAAAKYGDLDDEALEVKNAPPFEGAVKMTKAGSKPKWVHPDQVEKFKAQGAKVVE